MFFDALAEASQAFDGPFLIERGRDFAAADIFSPSEDIICENVIPIGVLGPDPHGGFCAAEWRELDAEDWGKGGGCECEGAARRSGRIFVCAWLRGRISEKLLPRDGAVRHIENRPPT